MNKSACDKSRLKFRERIAKPCFRWLSAFGLNPLALRHTFANLGSAVRQYRRLKRQNCAVAKPWRLRFNAPCLEDCGENSGNTGGHYFFQDWLVARRVFKRNPVKHVDVGSRIDGFVGHVATFREIEVFDIRPLPQTVPTLLFRQADLMRLPDSYQNYCDSLSCLHALEHFGLGRYGDALDIDGHVKGFDALCNILRFGGTLYLSVPIGPERIDFNANRVFSVAHILAMATDKLALQDFSYIDDDGTLHEHVPLEPTQLANNFNCQYGCGIFEFQKIGAN